MSFYEPQGWQAPQRQASWEQPVPPSRSGTSSAAQREETNAFASQYEEIDRVIDNLVKSGKFFGPGSRAGPGPAPSMMGGGRGYNDHNPRMHTSRHSMEFDPVRSGSAGNVQSFYSNQRYQGRQTEAEQMQQAKRRMAAQRERELRNYHQEQQYNRSVLAEMSSNKSDRSMSPSTLSEEGRRELIARQRQALYGNEAPGFLPQGAFSDDGSNPSANIPTSAAGGARGNSPRGMDPFGMPSQSNQGEGNTSADINRMDKSSSPSAGNAPSQQFGLSQKAPTPPTGEEGHSRNISKSTTAPVGGGMGPIGSRPSTQGQGPAQGINKRSTTPLYNFGGNNDQSAERAGSSNSNANNQKDNSNAGSGIGAWGTGSGVWGSNKIGGTAVWG